MTTNAFAQARLAAHWAAQLAAAAGATLIPRAPDDSHAALEWRGDALVGALAGARRAGLCVAELTLVIGEGDRSDVLPLAGHTLADGLAWLSEKFGRALARPTHELPDSPVASGGAFPAVTPELAALAAWFSSADATLRALAAATPGASPVRCWPHHFDIATSISLDPGAAAETARSIGAGLSPGDGSYAEPYWYVTPWPYPPRENLPALPAGAHWHTEGWVGAVLTASALGGRPDPDRAAAFLDAAVAACRTLLGAR